MRAYHNDPQIKARYVARFAAHRAADEVVQGRGFHEGRGCFVGCTLDRYAHYAFPDELGWPEWVAYLADGIFEGLPAGAAPQFGTDLLRAVPVGADLDHVRLPFLLLLQQRNLARLRDAPEPCGEACRGAVRDATRVLTLARGEMVDLPEGEALAAQRALRYAGSLTRHLPSARAPWLHDAIRQTLTSALAATRLAAHAAAADARYAAEAKRRAASGRRARRRACEAMRQRDDLISLVRGL